MKRSESKVNEIKPLPSDDAMQKKVVEVPPSVEAQSKKELKKYKGLYTYDASAPHCYVILVPKGDVDGDLMKNTLNKYNATNHPLLNLNVVELTTKDFEHVYVVSSFASADLGLSYMRQIVKFKDIKTVLGTLPYRNIVISKDNLEVLKSSGNINVYMELYKRLYLNR